MTLSAKDYINIALGKQNSNSISVSNKITVDDSDRHTIYHYEFNDGAIVEFDISEYGGNCWDISETIYTQKFLRLPNY